jgi:NAD(P)-dependent dehydrogenase (short-subunit alcohol dehydrogenase family)
MAAAVGVNVGSPARGPNKRLKAAPGVGFPEYHARSLPTPAPGAGEIRRRLKYARAMNDKRAVVTGAAGGLGRAFAEELARDGYTVVISDIDEAGLKETEALVSALGQTAHVTRCDVRNWSEVEALARFADARMGGTDLVINNAGVAVGGALEEVLLEDWKWVIDINLWGVIHGVKAFVPAMKVRGSGAVINVASVAGLIHAPELGPYNVTKAGVVALSETLYAEAKERGVRVTVLCPSFFNTSIMATARGPMNPKSLGMAKAFMEKASVQANGVARYALDANRNGELHALPMSDARFMWRFKRTAPTTFQNTANKIIRSKWIAKLAGK